jgi:phage terminase large subunit GpA-like protein
MHFFIVTKKKRWKDLDPDLPLVECGFRLPIFLTPNVNWSQTVAAYIKSLDDPDEEADFNNSWLAKPVENENVSNAGDVNFNKLKGSWLCEKNEIPEGVVYLTGAVDVGDYKLWFVLTGWGNDGRKYVIRALSVDRGSGVGAIEEAMMEIFPMCNPANYRCKGPEPKFCGGLIDTGDGEDTAELYEFCEKYPSWKASKGNCELKNMYRVVKLGDSDSKYKKQFKSLVLYEVDTNKFQSWLQKSLGTPIGEPKSIQFAEDAPALLFTHLRNQQKTQTRKGMRDISRWGKIGKRPDHLRDALVLSIAAGYIMGIHKGILEIAPKQEAQVNVLVRAGNLLGRG